jgi:hypothetical protein
MSRHKSKKLLVNGADFLIGINAYEDFEEAVYKSERNVSAQELTKHLLNFKFLSCHLQDAVRIGFERFQYSWAEEEANDE